MPRNARFTIENGIYHVMHRGANKDRIFNVREDYQKLLILLAEKKRACCVKLYHFALMPNHLHLVLYASTGKELSVFMKRVAVGYAVYYRKKYGGIGHFFQDRFKSCLIQNGTYLLECGRYIELNPVKAGIVDSPEKYEWSSYRHYSGVHKFEFLELSPEYLGLGEHEADIQKAYKAYVDEGFDEKRDEERYFRQGYYGSDQFGVKLREKGLNNKWSHSGRPYK